MMFMSFRRADSNSGQYLPTISVEVKFFEIQAGSREGELFLDITHTDKVTGVNANFLTPSLAAATLPDTHGGMSLSDEAKAWKTIWSAGHGVGATRAERPARAIAEELIQQYREAATQFCKSGHGNETASL